MVSKEIRIVTETDKHLRGGQQRVSVCDVHIVTDKLQEFLERYVRIRRALNDDSHFLRFPLRH